MTALSPTYLCFGCVDVANNARLKAYIGWACSTGKFEGDPGALITYMHHLCACPADDEEWSNPIDDNACWYDPSIPESADFLGIQIEFARGVRSANVKREVSDAIAGGSVLGIPTVTGKQIVLEVMIVSTSKAGQNYGIQWLNRQFEGDGQCSKDGSSCSSCQGQLLTIRTHCYVPGDMPEPVDKGLHSWAAAGVIDGFVPDEDRFPAGRVNCDKLMAGTLTIATEQRDSYSTDPWGGGITFDAAGEFMFRALGNCLPGFVPGDIADPRCPSCMELCNPCQDDPGCDCLSPSVLIEPEIETQVSACFTDPLCRCIGSGQLTDIPSGYETTMRLKLRAGWNPGNQLFQKYGMRNAVIRIWERPEIEETQNGIVMPTNLAEYEALEARIRPCAEIGVAWIPAGSELVIDGLTGRTWLNCNGECYDHSSRVHTISGTVFPLKARCTDLIFTMEWDCLNVQGEGGDGLEPSSLTVETYLGFLL